MKQLYWKTAVIALILGCSVKVNAQRCKTSVIRAQHLKNHPELKVKIDRIQEFTKEYVKNYNPNASRAVLKVPVVVHIVYRTNEENISDEQVYSQMRVLNDDFRKKNANFSNTPSAFQALAADVEIEFCLSAVDPAGKASTGITRTQTSIDNIGATNKWYSTAQGGKDPWDNSKFINVWVCDIGDDGTLGFATPPGAANPIESDGMVIGHQYFGTIGTAANSAPNNLGRTATHEMGHYFNLEHLWGPGNGGCSEDDFVADTPEQDKDSGGCPGFPETDNCTTGGNGIMFNNYLDYADDNCMTMFTLGQKKRMLACLNGPRKDLLQSVNCSTLDVDLKTMNKRKITVYPNPVQHQLNVEVGSDKMVGFQLINALGVVVRSIAVQGTTVIDVSELESGLYVLRTTDGIGFAKQLVITK